MNHHTLLGVLCANMSKWLMSLSLNLSPVCVCVYVCTYLYILQACVVLPSVNFHFSFNHTLLPCSVKAQQKDDRTFYLISSLLSPTTYLLSAPYHLPFPLSRSFLEEKVLSLTAAPPSYFLLSVKWDTSVKYSISSFFLSSFTLSLLYYHRFTMY